MNGSACAGLSASARVASRSTRVAPRIHRGSAIRARCAAAVRQQQRFKYGRAVGASKRQIALSAIPVEHRRAVGLETILATPRQGQGKLAAASPAAVSGRACSTRAQERPWPGRGIADRALRGQVMNAPLEAGPFPFGGASRRGFCAARRPSASSRKCRRHLRKSSAYADRGTALHAAMALCIDEKRDSRRASSARRSTATRSHRTTSRTRCGRRMPT